MSPHHDNPWAKKSVSSPLSSERSVLKDPNGAISQKTTFFNKGEVVPVLTKHYIVKT
jgi:hypothetical protein